MRRRSLRAARAAAPSKPISTAKSLPAPTLTADLSEASKVQARPLDYRAASCFRMIQNAAAGNAAREMKHFEGAGAPTHVGSEEKGSDAGNLAECEQNG